MAETVKQLLLNAIGGWLPMPVVILLALALAGWWIGRDERVRKYRRRKPVETLIIYVGASAVVGVLIWWMHGQPMAPSGALSQAPMEQKSTGSSSPNVATFGPNSPVIIVGPPEKPSGIPEEQRIRLAAELDGLIHTFTKRWNEWETASITGDRALADRKTRETKEAWGPVDEWLKRKMGPDVAGYVRRSKPNEPYSRGRLATLMDGNWLNEMHYRITRAEEVMAEIRSGKRQPIGEK